ncbi:MAG: DNA mismatch repair protein MutS [Oscillospiraceae bacterium]|nr:DNA mismatch repair protein MutS [Oscillospiraceae bacterium]
MMRQYTEVKERYADCVLFYRLGDFYEMFFEDALTASRELEIALTGKDCGLDERAPMCGVPYHALDGYLTRLVAKGYKVAICEQTEDPKTSKGLVGREVVRVVTPGTVLEPQLLDDNSNAYLMSVYKDGAHVGLAVTDLSTGMLHTAQIDWGNTDAKLIDEISKFGPREIVANPGFFSDTGFYHSYTAKFDIYTSELPPEYFDEGQARERIAALHAARGREAPLGNEETSLGSGEAIPPEAHGSDVEAVSPEVLAGATDSPQSNDMADFAYGGGSDLPPLCARATGSLLRYLDDTQKRALGHFSRVMQYRLETYMMIDAASRRNLEISETIKNRTRQGSLLDVVDRTLTPPGARLLKNWLAQPLLDIAEIEARHGAVGELRDGYILRTGLRERLRRIRDIERLISRAALGNVTCRDLLSLRNSINEVPGVKAALAPAEAGLLRSIWGDLDELMDISGLIGRAISEDAPLSLKDGNIIRDGYNSEVDGYRAAARDGKSWLTALEKKERESTGIKTMKIGYNRVFGYYFEITNPYKHLAPPGFVRRQTLANGERYISDELKKLEDTILGAEERLASVELELFNEVRHIVASQAERIKKTARALAELDVLAAFAELAERENYCRPAMNRDGVIVIKEGRHPVVEKALGRENFVPNDVYLDTGENRTSIITGPNMAGKSTYMRQIALTVLLAQAGSFVPAMEADIGITDRIFTRVGAADDLAAGQSTFMAEMAEVSNILSNATPNSLIILDEIGRGTSTFDGLSIAWAVVEFINDKARIGARTLFSTHYHELTELSGKLEGVNNYCVTVSDSGGGIRFLRKIAKGGADGSYGIEVAKLAGLPMSVTERASALLKELEDADISKKAARMRRAPRPVDGQVDFLSAVDEPKREREAISALREMDITRLTPMDALNFVYSIQQKLKLE